MNALELGGGELQSSGGGAPGRPLTARDAYLLGHSEYELDRLSTQARVIDPITRRYFRDAGIETGMRVLDVGSGVGDVAFLAADIVGPRGEVVGIDRAAPALAVARARAEERSLSNVRFLEGELNTVKPGDKFDAVIGRYVLMFQPDPVATLRAVLGHARRNAVVAFHEPHWTSTTSHPPAPTYDTCYAWIMETVRRSGPDIHMGLRLHGTFLAAGLPEPTMRLEALMGGGEQSLDTIVLLADLARTLAPEMERQGVVSRAELDVDTLADRMYTEAIALGSVVVGRLEVGAWCRAS